MELEVRIILSLIAVILGSFSAGFAIANTIWLLRIYPATEKREDNHRGGD